MVNNERVEKIATGIVDMLLKSDRPPYFGY